MIESGILIFYLKYLIKNNYPIMSIVLGIIAIIIIGLIYPSSSKLIMKKLRQKKLCHGENGH